MITDRPPCLGDTCGFLVDHAELAPDAPGVDRNSLTAIAGRASGARKTLTMSTGTGTSRRLLKLLLAENFDLAWVDRNHAVSVAFEVVADEMARPQFVAG